MWSASKVVTQPKFVASKKKLWREKKKGIVVLTIYVTVLFTSDFLLLSTMFESFDQRKWIGFQKSCRDLQVCKGRF